MREYNNSTGEITSVNTEEMELVLAGGGTLMQSSSSRSNSTGKSLRDMIDDPYGSVGKDTIATSSPIPRVPRSEEDLESPTGILEDADFGSSNKQNIVILDEQSSLQEEDV